MDTVLCQLGDGVGRVTGRITPQLSFAGQPATDKSNAAVSMHFTAR